MKMAFNDKSPLYLQLVRRIKEDIISMNLLGGEAMPSVRQISASNAVNHQTVLKATRILLEENLIEKRRGLGMFVRVDARKRLLQREMNAFIEDDLPAFLKRAHLLNLNKQALIEIIKSVERQDEDSNMLSS